MGAVEGNRNREMANAVASAGKVPVTQEQRRLVNNLHLASVVDREAAEEHAQWRNPELKAHWVVTHASRVEGGGAAISAWAAEESKRALGRGL